MRKYGIMSTLFFLVAVVVMATLFIEIAVGLYFDIDVFGFAHDHAFAWGLLLTVAICLFLAGLFAVIPTTNQEDDLE